MTSDIPPKAILAEFFPCAQHQAGESLSDSFTLAQGFDLTPTVIATSQTTWELHYQRRVFGLPVTIVVDQGLSTGATGVALLVRRGSDQWGMAAQAWDILLAETKATFGEPDSCSKFAKRPKCFWRTPHFSLSVSLERGEMVPHWRPEAFPNEGMMPHHGQKGVAAVLGCKYLDDLGR